MMRKKRCCLSTYYYVLVNNCMYTIFLYWQIRILIIQGRILFPDLIAGSQPIYNTNITIINNKLKQFLYRLFLSTFQGCMKSLFLKYFYKINKEMMKNCLNKSETYNYVYKNERLRAYINAWFALVALYHIFILLYVEQKGKQFRLCHFLQILATDLHKISLSKNMLFVDLKCFQY